MDGNIVNFKLPESFLFRRSVPRGTAPAPDVEVPFYEIVRGEIILPVLGNSLNKGSYQALVGKREGGRVSHLLALSTTRNACLGLLSKGFERDSIALAPEDANIIPDGAEGILGRLDTPFGLRTPVTIGQVKSWNMPRKRTVELIRRVAQDMQLMLSPQIRYLD